MLDDYVRVELTRIAVFITLQVQLAPQTLRPAEERTSLIKLSDRFFLSYENTGNYLHRGHVSYE